jgi:hypothetical protein
MATSLLSFSFFSVWQIEALYTLASRGVVMEPIPMRHQKGLFFFILASSTFRNQLLIY